VYDNNQNSHVIAATESIITLDPFSIQNI